MSFWRAIDWQRPWLAPYRCRGRAVCERLDAGDDVATALNAVASDSPPRLAAGLLRFVAQADLPPGDAYESFIHQCARVPTRNNLHDLFNGLAWIAWPAVKRRLNELHAAAIASAGVGATRGAVRDALTLLDENGALWPAPPPLAEALAAHDWRELFIEQRALWREAQPLLLGHALLEKLVRPRAAITAHVALLSPGQDADTSFEPRLSAQWLAAKPFLPLPVLGVPGWWAANEAPGFYDDATVFRPARTREALAPMRARSR